MAKVLLPLQSQAVSGKVIGVIHQVWRGLAIVRRFTMPTIRHTVKQVAQRVSFGTLPGYWSNVLTIAQRATWESMKLAISDLWGTSVRATGLDLYVKINNVLLNAGKTLLTDAPITSAMSSPEVVPAFVAGSSAIAVTKVSAEDLAAYSPFVDVWVAGVSVAGATVANVTEIQTTGVKASINPAKNVFRHVCYIDENATTDQTINFADTVGAALAGDIKISVLVIRYTKDGMKSVIVRSENITIAAV